jgi:uncharacterized protein YajQ (UPF0234 family)
MSRRRVALASVAVVMVLTLVGVSILAVASGGSALAFEVNGTRTSQDDINQQLDDIAHTKGLGTQVVHSEGSLDSKVASQILTANIVLQIVRDAAAKRGVKVTAEDRAQASQTIGTQLDKYPASYRALQHDLQAHFVALGLDSSDKVNAFVNPLIKRADVHVAPNYGHWNPKYGVCPPTGCASLATGG